MTSDTFKQLYWENKSTIYLNTTLNDFRVNYQKTPGNGCSVMIHYYKDSYT